MKIIIESTDKIVDLVTDQGVVPARIWEGHTSTGIAVHCYITRIAVHKDDNQEQFLEELKETRSPSAAVAAIPLRMIL